MRLINTSTYDLEEFAAEARPYAILSHTWRHNREMLFADCRNANLEDKQRYKKVDYVCAQARQHGLQYAWIDTICIDKSSSAELSEAINSMYQWYHDARICYVYLDDVEEAADLESCRWITRGWTLQELLAPSDVRFFGIDQAALEAAERIAYFSTATRMSWAASRSTTRIEDIAYCPLGIFGIAMPLLYGERERAFERLQEEILRQSGDISILIFDRSHYSPGDPHFLASRPSVFGKGPRVINETSQHECEFINVGIKTRVKILTISEDEIYGFLPCRFEFNTEDCIGIPVHRVNSNNALPEYRVKLESLRLFPYLDIRGLPYEEALLRKEVRHYLSDVFQVISTPSREVCRIYAEEMCLYGYELIYAGPEVGFASWDEKTQTSEVVWRRDSGAFIVMFAVIQGSDVNSYRAYLSNRLCPRTDDHHTWLKENGMYSASKLSHSQQLAWCNAAAASPKDVVIDNDSWVLIADKKGGKLTHSFRSCSVGLHRDWFYPYVNVTVEPLARVPDGWSISIVPEAGFCGWDRMLPDLFDDLSGFFFE